MLRVAFYKGKGKLVDRIIRLVTNGKYSHCEFLFPDGRMFSADAWSKSQVRFTTDYNLDNWDIVRIDISTEQMAKLLKWCEFKSDSKYDWLGVIRFVIPFIPQDPDKWFCSELCAAGLKYINILPSSLVVSKLSPVSLYNKLLENKGVPMSEETKAKVSAAKKGTKSTWRYRSVIRSDGEVFASIKEAAEAIQATYRGIIRVLSGERNFIYGRSFSYADGGGLSQP